MSVPYLIELGEKIREGLQRLPAETLSRHAAFFLSRQTVTGGFTGRDVDLNGNPVFEDGTQPDLYYTSFALRGLFCLGHLGGETAQRAADYLTSPVGQPRSIVDLVSWLSAAFLLQVATGIDVLKDAAKDWPEDLAAQFERCRTPDGGYAKTPAGASGSTYHTFLIVCCYQLIAQPVPDPDRMSNFLLARQRDDGGFVEIEPMTRSGTNPTAAAIATLKILNHLPDEVVDRAAEFLIEMRGDDGGFQANSRIPFSDVLSTFTGLVAALDMGRPDLLAPRRIARFLSELDVPSGGYLAAGWDHVPDVEYSFYGLGTVGLLQPLQA